MRLHERQWGALARLPAAKLKEAGYAGAQGRWWPACRLELLLYLMGRQSLSVETDGRQLPPPPATKCMESDAHACRTPTSLPAGDELPSHVAVVRDAFGSHDDSQRSLAHEVAALGPHKVTFLTHMPVPCTAMPCYVLLCHAVMGLSMIQPGMLSCNDVYPASLSGTHCLPSSSTAASPTVLACLRMCFLAGCRRS